WPRMRREHATERLLDPDHQPEVVLAVDDEPLEPVAVPDAVDDDAEALDPLRLYLDQTAREPLLTREEETAIAACIADVERARRLIALRSPIGVSWLRELGERIRAGALGPREVCGDDADEGPTADRAWFRRRMPVLVSRVLRLVREADML